MKERLYLYDTTLRDGAQTLGVDFSLEDKRVIAERLDALGIDYIEGGYPGANPVDTAFFEGAPQLKGKLVSFGMTKRAGRSASNDPGFQTVVQANAAAVCLVAKSWDYHVEVALGITGEENLEAIAASVDAVLSAGREALIDCEHFFDGYKANPAYALACAKAAHEAGARWVVLCDTNGGTLPHEVEEIVAEIVRHIPPSRVGIHAHNDTENAVANTLAAIRAGARQVQGTLNGLGERCGNANLTSIIPTLILKEDYASRFETGVSAQALSTLTAFSRQFDELLNRQPNRHAPYVGESAFAHKGGIHASAVSKEPRTYEHVPPESVGNLAGFGVEPGWAVEHPGRAGAHWHGGGQERPAPCRPSGAGEDARGARLCLRSRRRLFRIAGAARLRPGAGLFRCRKLPRHGRAAPQRAGRTRYRVRRHRQGAHRG